MGGTFNPVGHTRAYRIAILLSRKSTRRKVERMARAERFGMSESFHDATLGKSRWKFMYKEGKSKRNHPCDDTNNLKVVQAMILTRRYAKETQQ
jgi:hypothetical protein